MTVAHLLGFPLEETILQLVPAGVALATAVAVAGRAGLERLRGRARPLRPRPEEQRPA